MRFLIAQAGAATKVAGETQGELMNFVEQAVTKVPLWIAAFILFVFTFFAAKLIRSYVENKIEEKGIEEEHKEIPILAGRATYATVMIIGVTAALKVAGIDITSIIAAVAFGLGFALKDLIMNFLAGIMILMSRQFTIGDFIKIEETIGQVVEIQSRATILRAFDGTKIIVPNADLFTNQVTSYTSNPFRRFEIEVGVDYRTDLRNAVQICTDATNKTTGVLAEPATTVIVSEFADSAITLVVKAWCESRAGFIKIRSDVMHNLKEKLDEANIVIPWPIRTIAYDKEQAPATLVQDVKSPQETPSPQIGGVEA